MLTAAARTARTLVWPADVPETRRPGGRVRGAARRAREARPDRRHAQISGSAWYRRAGGRADDQTGLRGCVLRYDSRPMSVSEPIASRRMLSLDADVLRVAQKVREVGRALDERYLDKSELVRMLLVTLVAGEHMLIVGPPGTAKSALIRHLARLIDARYFEYLLTRFSEPNEIFGPIDIKAFREGTYVRRVEAMLPDADIVFLDEIFKSNSAILNSLLSILNERRFFTGSASIQVPLSSLYGATNEIPNDDALARGVRSLPGAGAVGQPRQLPLPRSHRARAARRDRGPGARRGRRDAAVEGAARPLVSLAEIRLLKARLAQHLQFPGGLPGPLQGPGLPDPVGGRDAQRPPRRQAAQAVRGERADRRPADRRRRRLLRAAPRLEQRRSDAASCDDIVGPVLERYRRDHPEARVRRAERARSRRHPGRAGRHPQPPAGRRAAVGRAAVLAAAQPAGDPGGAAGDRHRHRADRWRARSTSCSRACSSRHKWSG